MPVWNNTFEANPKGTDTPAEGDDRIRELKAATRERIEHEHTMNLGSGVVGEDGWHRAGSAKVYVGSNAPTHRPNGSAVLDAQDDGRLWLSSVDFSLRAYRHAAGSTTSERWEIVSGSGSSGENYVKNNLTKPNIAGVFNDTTGTTTVSWDATATDLLNVGALKIVLTNAAVGRFVDIDLSPLNANNVGQQWSIKLSYKLDTAADDLVSFFLFDGTTETPTTLNSLPYAGGTMQTVSGAVYPTTTLSNVRLRARFKDSTACTLYLADLNVGPFNPFGGAAIGNWTSFTPVMEGVGTPTNGNFLWRRVGSSIEVVGRATLGTPTAVLFKIYLPVGLTQINTNGNNIVGDWYFNSVGSGAGKRGTLQGESNSTYITGSLAELTLTVTPYSAQNANALFAASGVAGFHFSVPIAQWTSNINLVQDFQEFAYNTSTSTTANDTTSFGYGSEGSLFSAITAQLRRRVRFLRPIQPTDTLIVEYGINGIWSPVGQTLTDLSTFDLNTFTTQGTISYGFGRITRINATDIEIGFGTYAGVASNAYGGIGFLWSQVHTAGVRWRVRKISNGNMAEFDTRKLDGSVNVTGNYTVGNEQTVNVEAATANITIPAGLPIGTRKTIRKLHATTTSSVNILRSGSEVFTSASLTSVPIFGDGSFWIIEKVTSIRWELISGSDIASNTDGTFTREHDGRQLCEHTRPTGNSWFTNGAVYQTTDGTWTFPQPFITAPLTSGLVDMVNAHYGAATITTTSLTFRAISGQNSASLPRNVRQQAEGRWY